MAAPSVRLSASLRCLLQISCLIGWVRGTLYDAGFANVTWDDQNWRLTTTYANQGHYQARASLANGYIGISVAALGPFFEVDTPVNGDMINGWPLFDRRQTFATVAGFWDVQPMTNGTNYVWLDKLGGESVISGLPHWSGLLIQAGDSILNASTPISQITGFSSTLDMGAGELSWRYTWTPSLMPSMDIEYSMVLHKLYVNQAVTQLKVTPSRNVNVTIIDVLNGDGALRTKAIKKMYETSSPTIWTAVQPNGISYSTAYVYSTMVGDGTTPMSTRKHVTSGPYLGTNVSSIAQSVQAHLVAGQTTFVKKYVGIASTDAFADPQSVAMNSSFTASKTGYVKLLQSQITEWESIMPKNTLDSYHFPENGSLPDDINIVQQQIAAVVNPFYLLQNTMGENALTMAENNPKLGVDSIAVSGLGSESYAGLIFWDAEVWMSPGLVVAHPQAASQIAKYRANRLPTAKANIKEAYTSSAKADKFGADAAIYSWTSGRFGNCTGTGPCFDYEYHINGDIGLELKNYYVVTGDAETFQKRYFPVYDAIAETYSDLLHLDTSTGKYMLLNATDPDEYANNKNNPGYTMVLIQEHLNMANKFRQQFGMPVNQNWTQKANNVEIPVSKEANIILEYTGMNGSISVKQADVVLVDDFLNYQNPYTLSDLDFYAGRQSLNGPGMTYCVFSVVAAKIAPAGCSDYTYQIYGSQPYARAPWFQYSEQLNDDYTTNGGTHPAYPFLTGMGGANRVSVFAYLGLKLLPESLNVNPTLPPQIPNLTYRTIYWQGYSIQAVANQTHTTLQRTGANLPTANPKYASSAIPVTVGFNTQIHALAPHSKITLPNRQPGLSKTVPGNLAQCRPVDSSTAFEPGQFPLAAVDGAASTKWQPTDPSAPASLTVDLGVAGSQPITGFAFDWAQAPPTSYSVHFSNASAPSSPKQIRNATAAAHVRVSNPYNPKNALTITPYMSNTTNVTLPAPVWGGRYATLTIMGSQSGVAGGASVAEWAILGKGYKPLMRRFYDAEEPEVVMRV